ncbi:hypothetical protein DCS_01376 [Drechmeria coniospora]|uniref:Arylsulfotransferase n=1 Tax=Drechmeria coniospora TaxID=98403 RepID=A0A151GSZ4_DRECN|nr:hypothetical protein DCS_01376 [Drechmeria coniospora]KYK60239.1 hypothetical protein DCS_01376 [Drechmeria coniospora]
MRNAAANIGLALLAGLSPRGGAAAMMLETPAAAHFEASPWFDWGWHGAYPRQSYRSFGAQSPKPNLLRRSDECDGSGLVFVEPRGVYVEAPGPVILDNDGNLVWTETRWGQAVDLKVQRYRNHDYITFWHGTEGAPNADGGYVMLDQSYQIYKTIRPVGNFDGDAHEFRITADGTALLSIRKEARAPATGDAIYDSIFQEIDIDSGALLFEWHASHHFAVSESKARPAPDGGPVDFFHLNSIDKGPDGNYLVSSEHLGAVACISRGDGHVVWQLGGAHNDFEDRSEGEATAFVSNRHATWLGNSTTLTLLDSGAAGGSRGKMIELDVVGRTATLVGAYREPRGLNAHGGSVQVLPGDNVLVGWEGAAGYTEFSPDGDVLCDTRLAPRLFANLGWVTNYRASKHRWVGRPSTVPDLAMRPDEDAVYVSWNGATEVDAWVLQSGPDRDGTTFVDHYVVDKVSFETRIPIPRHTEEYIRVVALDGDWRFLAHSHVVSKHSRTVARPLFAPLRRPTPQPLTLLVWALAGLAIATAAVYRHVTLCRRRRYLRLLRQETPAHEYKSAPKS